MQPTLHVVLGATGATGRAVVAELITQNLTVRAVSRHPQNIPGVETVQADLLNAQQTIEAIAGATYVYLCASIPYQSKAWAEQWPILIQNVIDACERAQANLVFFDNVYMYGPAPLQVPFAESHPQQPISHKGIARKLVADCVLEAHKSGRIRAVIARSADFYGPHAVNSVFYINFLQNMLRRKAPTTLGKLDVKHTYAYASDNGRAMIALAVDPGAYGEVWHLPVSEPITFQEVASIMNNHLGTNLTLSMLPRPILQILSLFVSPLKEVKEMLYQFDHPYIMSWEKFRHRYPDFQVTTVDVGVKAMIESFRE